MLNCCVIETIRIGGLELEFLHSKDNTADSLDMFRMTVQPNARMPVPHYHESWDETVYGLTGTLNLRVNGQDIAVDGGMTVGRPATTMNAERAELARIAQGR